MAHVDLIQQEVVHYYKEKLTQLQLRGTNNTFIEVVDNSLQKILSVLLAPLNS